ncbi:MAG: PASTA domain-containing protein [Saprospiraceae bacterium]
MKERFINAIKGSFYFISSKIFLKNFSIAILGLVCFFLLTFQGLKCYTNHGESVSVPNFKDQTLGQIKAQLRKSNLNIQVIDSSAYDPDKLPLTIMEQTPLPTKETGLKVKEHRTIYLTVNPIIPPSKPLPSIWDKDESVAMRILENNGFRGVVKERRPDKAKNTVLEIFVDGKKLDRTKKHQLKANSKVELIIADGGGSEVNVPKVMCMQYNEAEFLVQGSNLNIIIVDKDGTVTDENTAYIWKQNPMPEPGLRVTVGEEIGVWLTSTMPPGCTDNTLDSTATDNGGTTIPDVDDNDSGLGDDFDEDDFGKKKK